MTKMMYYFKEEGKERDADQVWLQKCRDEDKDAF